MKRLLAALLVFVLSIGLFAACSPQEQTPELTQEQQMKLATQSVQEASMRMLKGSVADVSIQAGDGVATMQGQMSVKTVTTEQLDYDIQMGLTGMLTAPSLQLQTEDALIAANLQGNLLDLAQGKVSGKVYSKLSQMKMAMNVSTLWALYLSNTSSELNTMLALPLSAVIVAMNAEQASDNVFDAIVAASYAYTDTGASSVITLDFSNTIYSATFPVPFTAEITYTKQGKFDTLRVKQMIVQIVDNRVSFDLEAVFLDREFTTIVPKDADQYVPLDDLAIAGNGYAKMPYKNLASEISIGNLISGNYVATDYTKYQVQTLTDTDALGNKYRQEKIVATNHLGKTTTTYHDGTYVYVVGVNGSKTRYTKQDLQTNPKIVQSDILLLDLLSVIKPTKSNLLQQLIPWTLSYQVEKRKTTYRLGVPIRLDDATGTQIKLNAIVREGVQPGVKLLDQIFTEPIAIFDRYAKWSVQMDYSGFVPDTLFQDVNFAEFVPYVPVV